MLAWLSGIAKWPFIESNAISVAGWGFWFGIGGVALSLIGFGITFRQLKKTKDASQAAKEEVDRIRASLVKYDNAQEASRAAYALSTTLRHVRNGMWRDAADSYNDVRRSLTRLRATSGLAREDAEGIDSAATYISRLCQRIEDQHYKGAITIDAAKTSTVIRRHEELVVRLTENIKRGIYG